MKTMKTMKTIRIVGQPPKMRRADGSYLRLAYDGEVIGQPQPVTDDLFGDDPATRYCTIGEGGGFDDPEITHEFRVPGSVIRRVSNGNPHCYSVTEVDVPSA